MAHRGENADPLLDAGVSWWRAFESGGSPSTKNAGLIQTHAGVDHGVEKIRDQIS